MIRLFFVILLLFVIINSSPARNGIFDSDTVKYVEVITDSGQDFGYHKTKRYKDTIIEGFIYKEKSKNLLTKEVYRDRVYVWNDNGVFYWHKEPLRKIKKVFNPHSANDKLYTPIEDSIYFMNSLPYKFTVYKKGRDIYYQSVKYQVPLLMYRIKKNDTLNSYMIDELNSQSPQHSICSENFVYLKDTIFKNPITKRKIRCYVFSSFCFPGMWETMTSLVYIEKKSLLPLVIKKSYYERATITSKDSYLRTVVLLPDFLASTL